MEILGTILLVLCIFVYLFVGEDEAEDSYKIHKYFRKGFNYDYIQDYP